MDQPDIGIFFGRPGRSEILAERLRTRGFPVMLYNSRGLPGQYSSVSSAFLPAFSCLLSTRHRIYLTAMGAVPSLCLYLNRTVRGLPYILNATGLRSQTYRDRASKWPFSRIAERWFYPTLTDKAMAGASRIVCNSRYLQAELESQFPQYSHKMITIYNGIDFKPFVSAQPNSINGISSEAPTLLATMTWNYQAKAAGARLLIDAMGLILKRYPEARLTIAAKTTRPRGYVQENEDYLSTIPWRDSIKFLYNQTNVPDLLASCDLFVYATPPDSNDSLPRALLEAHAAGLPIVTTATAGCPEVVEDSVTGFAVPYDAEALAGRVIDLLADPTRRQEMGRRGRERVYDIFNWDQMADKYAKVFLELADNRGSLQKNSERPLVVEFAGLPGAGKTTVARRVISELNSSGYKCFSRDMWREISKDKKPRLSTKEFYHFFVFCAHHTHAAFNALSYAVRVTPLNMRSLRHGLSLLRKLYFIKRAIREGDKGDYDIILLDQGLIQYIWSTAIPASPPPDIRLMRLLKSVSDHTPQAIVFFDVDIDTGVERIGRRSTMGSYFDRISPDEAEVLMAKHKWYMEAIVDCAVQLNGTCRLNVSGDDDVGKSVASIVRFIDETWQTRNHRTLEA